MPGSPYTPGSGLLCQAYSRLPRMLRFQKMLSQVARFIRLNFQNGLVNQPADDIFRADSFRLGSEGG